MPLLSFTCKKCKDTFEDIVAMGTVEAKCPRCGEMCPRLYEGECNLHVPGNPTGRLRKGAGAPGAGEKGK